uniref:Uncharacterized protein n=1 Tax=Ignisphaera aggregans TaxID=334771 RepID=A0A7J3JQE6_9CREN
MTEEVLEIDPELIKRASTMLAESLLNGEISIEYGKQIIFESEVYEVNLENVVSIVAGLTDPIGQIRDWITGVLRDLWGIIKSALAEIAAEILKKLGEVAPEVASRIADAIRIFSKGIADSINIIGGAITTQLYSIAGGITALSVSINNLGTSISGLISMIGTSLSTTILQVSHSISQSILMVATSITNSIVMVGAGISQTILSVSTSISQSILMVATSIAGGITQIATAVSAGIAQVASSIAFGIGQISGAIATATIQITGAIANGLNMLGGALSKLILDSFFSLSTGISMLSTSLSQAILTVGTSITTVIGGFVTTMIANMYLLAGKMDYAIGIMQTYFPTFTDSMVRGFKEMSSAINTAFKDLSSTLKDVYRDTVDKIRESMIEFSNTINTIMRESVRTISENMTVLTRTITENLKLFISVLLETSKMVTTTLIENFERTSRSILEVYEKTSKAIQEATSTFTDMLKANFEKISDALRESYQKSVQATIDTGESLRDYITETSRTMTDVILENLDKTMDKLRETLEKWAGMMEFIGKTFEGFVNSILLLPEKLEPTARKHAEYTWSEYWRRFYEETSADFKLVYQHIPRLFKEESPSPWDVLLRSILALEKGLTTSIVIVPVTFPPNAVVASPGTSEQAIRKAASMPLFFSPVGEMVSIMVTSLGGFFEAHVLPALSKIGEMIWNAITSFVQTVTGWIKSMVDAIWKAISSLAEGIANILIQSSTSILMGIGLPSASSVGISHSPEVELIRTETIKNTVKAPPIIKQLFDGLIDLGFNAISSLGELIYTLAGGMFDVLIEPVKRKYPDIIGKIATREEIQTSLKNLFLANLVIINMPLISQIVTRATSHILYQIGGAIYNSDFQSKLSLRPFGIGIDFNLNLGKLFGGALSHFSKELKDYADTLGAGLTYGLSIWLTQPLSKLGAFMARNIIPVELPTVDDILEMLRRALPHEKFNEIHAKAMYFLGLYGYSDAVINLMTSKIEEYHITIKDRFERERKIPLSLMYELPSASDVARMMVRDIIIELEDFRKIFKSRGMTDDIAVLYYLLHFRYPPPEKLWSFVTRGISGLLWYSPAPGEESVLRREAETVGGFVPVPASSLNFKGDILLKAFSAYMKWHDYARFSYISGFTSDNQIYIDTLADIPTKIDQRWMVRFGLYELLAEKGISITDPINAFVTKLVEGTARGQIALDLTNFCRTLQATGLHPYYVPIVAVAETINTITDERTLLRTGVLNLYKEGFLTLQGVDALFTGVINTAFKVAYYDVSTNQWKVGYINAPLRYLPMESKLMQLRAIIDRSLDILKDIQKDILTGYQEYIIETYEEFKTRFEKVIESINKIYAEEYKAVVGESPPEKLQLKFIEPYYQAYLNALQIWRDIYVIRRVRAWTMRWIGWLMYRIAFGVVKPEELSKLVEFLSKASKLTDFEKQFLKNTMEFMAQLSFREYIPTPSQLATLAEYVRIPDDVIVKVFDARGVPEEFRGMWLSYIRVRPIADDAKAVISAYRKALLYTPAEKPLPADLVSSVKKVMAMIGFTEEEEALLNLRVALEEYVLNIKEYAPPPSTLATLAEYVPIPRELIEKTMKLRRIPEEWASLWAKYIDIKPIADDVRGLITTLFRAIEYTEEAKEHIPKVEAIAREAGFSERELSIFKLRVELEELIYKSRSYVPTPITLASIAEVLPEARYFFDDMVKRLRISSEWASLWAKYIDIRPLIDDIKKMLSRAEDLFCTFMITEEAFMAILKSVQELLGYTDKEIDFLLYTTKLRRHHVAWREVIGDVDRMVMLSEYSPTAREFALGTLYKMIDSLNIDDNTKALLKKMWEDFIRIRPVIDEVKKYVTDLINAYIEGTISQQIFESELEALKEWGLDDYEIQFYKAIATLRKARKLKIQFY